MRSLTLEPSPCLCWGILVCRAGLVQTALSHLHHQWADVGQGTTWGNPQHIKDQLEMAKHVFRQLTLQIASQTSATHTYHVGLDEQVAIFLYTMVTNLSNRKVAEHFQRSGDTISKYVMLPFPWAIC